MHHTFNKDKVYKADRLTYFEKTKKNFEACKNKIDEIDSHFGYESNRWDLHYKVTQGLLSEEDYKDLDAEDFHSNTDIRLTKAPRHFNIIAKIIGDLKGEMLKRPMDMRAIDSSFHANNSIKQEKKKEYLKYIQEVIIAPIEQEVLQQVQQQLQQQMQSPEMQNNPQAQQEASQQAQAQMEEMKKARTPDDIKKYFNKDFRLPSEKMVQGLLEYLNRVIDFKGLSTELFERALITSMSVAYVDYYGDKAKVEIVHPEDFRVKMTKSNRRVEEGIFSRHEKTMSIHEIYEKYKLKPKQEKYLKTQYLDDNYTDRQDRRLLRQYTTEDLQKFNLNPKTEEGQYNLMTLRNTYGVDEIRVIHCQWRWLSKYKLVTKYDGSEQYYTEDYVFNPLNGDVREEVVWLPEIWEGTKISDDLYVNIGPVKNQHISYDNPRHVELSYKGIIHNRFFEEECGVSIVDRLLPFQFWMDITRTNLERILELDVGKVMMMQLQAKPDDWTWEKWFEVLREQKLAVLDTTSEGFTSADTQAVRGVDMSMTQDIQKLQNLLEYIEAKAASSVGINPARLGQNSPYATATSNQQDIIQSMNTTESLYYQHNKFMERLIQNLVDVVIYNLKDNTTLRYMLDNMSVADLEINAEVLKRAEIGIFLSNQGDDIRNLQVIQQNLLPLIQNGLTPKEFVRFLNAKSMSEINEVVEDIEVKQQEQQQQEQKNIESQQQQQQQMLQMELAEKEKDRQKDLQVAELAAQRFERQNDINHNQISDAFESKMLEMNQRAEEIHKQLIVKQQEIDNKKLIDLENIKLKTLELQEKFNLSDRELKQSLQLKEKELKLKEKETKARINSLNNNKK